MKDIIQERKFCKKADLFIRNNYVYTTHVEDVVIDIKLLI